MSVLSTVMFDPTAEQVAILDAVRGSDTSIMVIAYAGTGKTTTLTLIAQATDPSVPGLALAFNVSAKKNLEAKFPPHFSVMTMNGLGHRAWMKAIPGKKILLDEKKLGRLVTKICKGQSFEASSEQWSGIRELVSHAMMSGLVPKAYPNQGLLADNMDSWGDLVDSMYIPLGEREIELARLVLAASVAEAFEGTISFDDQIYMPTMFNGVWPRFGLVLVDESQDLSPLNHIMVKRVSAGRLIIVGDPKQAIYAFRGADSASMGKLKALRKDWIELPLATTFRCSKVVVARQQAHAPGFVAFHRNAEGAFSKFFGTSWLTAEAKPRLEWDWTDIARHVDEDKDTLAVLCRNNAPLLAMAFKLLAQGIPVTMLGRDIGKGLIALSKKVLPDDSMGGPACVLAVNEWREGEVALARANGKEAKEVGVHDRADCLLAVLDSGKAKDAKQVREFLERLFARPSGQVTLSTGHKAKGLEFDVVLHLDPWRLPSKQAQRAPNGAQMEQERNLRYVIETRAKRTLLEANLDQFVSS